MVKHVKISVSTESLNRTVCNGHQCRKTTVLSFHRCLLKTGVKNELHLNIDLNFDHQMSLSKSKC